MCCEDSWTIPIVRGAMSNLCGLGYYQINSGIRSSQRNPVPNRRDERLTGSVAQIGGFFPELTRAAATKLRIMEIHQATVYAKFDSGSARSIGLDQAKDAFDTDAPDPSKSKVSNVMCTASDRTPSIPLMIIGCLKD